MKMAKLILSLAAFLLLLPCTLFAVAKGKGRLHRAAAKQVITFGTAIQLLGLGVGDAELAHAQPYKLWIDQLNAQRRNSRQRVRQTDSG